MTDTALSRLRIIKERLAAVPAQYALPGAGALPEIVVVSKTHPAEAILPLLEAGHRTFGENRVQEAEAKWPALKARFPDTELHLIGHLQSNKAAEAVALFDVIESLDRPKLADALAAEMAKQNRLLPCYIQVNIGEEPQKGGVAMEELAGLLDHSRSLGLNIVGLMCIPPAEGNPAPHFALLRTLADRHGLALRSMGMSGDYEVAAAMGATQVRIGSALFGNRDP